MESILKFRVYLSYCINYSACVNVRQWPTAEATGCPKYIIIIIIICFYCLEAQIDL